MKSRGKEEGQQRMIHDHESVLTTFKDQNLWLCIASPSHQTEEYNNKTN